MAKKKLEELPVVGDTVVFQLPTLDYNGLAHSPYSVNAISIYYIERDASPDSHLYYKNVYNKEIEAEIKRLQSECAQDPCPHKLDELKKAKVRLDATAVKQPYNFRDGQTVLTVGGQNEPLYLGGKAFGLQNTSHGMFEFEWDTTGAKDGNYYIVWSWTPENGGKELKSQRTFSLYLTPVPLRATAFMEPVPTDKYDFLLKKYLPMMYKTGVHQDDVTGEVIEGLNWCVAREFTYLENLLSLLSECYDANVCPSKMLQILSNFYNVRLRTDNVNLQRRQAKNAMPLLKMKGTKQGLETALDQIGVRLNKLSLLWQVRSPYSWTESFTVEGDDEAVFELSRQPISEELQVQLGSESGEYIKVPSKFYMVVNSLGGEKKTLIFSNPNSSEFRLLKGDVLKVGYFIKEMPQEYKQLEDYIKSLPLADSRNEIKQKYPLKNWNVHLIEEDDPLFDVIVRERHPFCDPLTYGKIRTTFMFSENVYNMDTFNGSLRDSKEPCHIDHKFLDECTACRSSKFNLDVEIEELSDGRVTDALEVVKEYAPFHAQLNVMNICGAFTEFLVTPHEEIEMLVDYSMSPEDQITEVMRHEEEITCKIEYDDGRVETIKL